MAQDTYRDKEISRLRKELNDLCDKKRWEECPHDKRIATYTRYSWFTPAFVQAVRGEGDPYNEKPVCYRQCTECGFKF